jgi:hypothetical protein
MVGVALIVLFSLVGEHLRRKQVCQADASTQLSQHISTLAPMFAGAGSAPEPDPVFDGRAAA